MAQGFRHFVIALKIAPEASIFNHGLFERPVLYLDSVGCSQNASTMASALAMNIKGRRRSFQCVEKRFMVGRRRARFYERDFNEAETIGSTKGGFFGIRDDTNDGFNPLLMTGFCSDILDINLAAAI